MAGIWLSPILWAVSTPLKREMQTLAAPPTWLPSPATLGAYLDVPQTSALPRWYFNSIFTSFVMTFAVLVLGALCAYALSQIQFPGKNVHFWSLLAGFILPFDAMIVPLFMLMVDLGRVNTYAGIMLPQLVPVVIVIFQEFFDQVPKQLCDAAVIAGAGEFRILFNIYLPVNWGITWALAIITFIGSWNNFFWPFIVITTNDMITIPVGITQVKEMYGVAYARTMAVADLSGLPVASWPRLGSHVDGSRRAVDTSTDEVDARWRTTFLSGWRF